MFAGLGSLLLNKNETTVLETYFKTTLQNIQRLHQKTPRSVVFLLAGSLPAEAILHCRQLGLFSMICRLPNDPLNIHARYILTAALPSAKSWFQEIRKLCLQYGLPHPLSLLGNPPNKDSFKRIVKLKVHQYWLDLFRAEAAGLDSLIYFNPLVHSLTVPSHIWSSAGSNPFECSKTMVVAKMISGRYRTEQLCRYWSTNRSGHCLASTCQFVLGDLEHLLVHCPALQPTRSRLRNLWKVKAEQYSSLSSLMERVLDSPPKTQVQFILDPCGFPEIITLGQEFGNELLSQVFYLTRTYAFYLHKQKLVLTGMWPQAKQNYLTQTKTDILLLSGPLTEHCPPPTSGCIGELPGTTSCKDCQHSIGPSTPGPPTNEPGQSSVGVVATLVCGLAGPVQPSQPPLQDLRDTVCCGDAQRQIICGNLQQPSYHQL